MCLCPRARMCVRVNKVPIILQVVAVTHLDVYVYLDIFDECAHLRVRCVIVSECVYVN